MARLNKRDRARKRMFLNAIDVRNSETTKHNIRLGLKDEGGRPKPITFEDKGVMFIYRDRVLYDSPVNVQTAKDRRTHVADDATPNQTDRGFYYPGMSKKVRLADGTPLRKQPTPKPKKGPSAKSPTRLKPKVKLVSTPVENWRIVGHKD